MNQINRGYAALTLSLAVVLLHTDSIQSQASDQIKTNSDTVMRIADGYGVGVREYLTNQTQILDSRLDANDAELLEKALSLQGEGLNNENYESNVCGVSTQYIDDNGEVVVNLNSFGSCVFITPNLVLTNNHVVVKKSMADLYEKQQVVSTKDATYEDPKIVALIPAYDLALLKTSQANPNAAVLNVRDPTTDDYYLNMVVASFKGNPTNELNLHIMRTVEIKTGYNMNVHGQNGIPSLVVTPSLENGYSGSPLTSDIDESIIGLVTYRTDKGTHIPPVIGSLLQLVLDCYNDTQKNKDQ